MAQPVLVQKVLTAASATAICAAQTGGAAGLTVNGPSATGGVATLDTQRRVRVTCAANDAANTFVIVGTNDAGNPVTETVTGTSGSTTDTRQDFKTVTGVTPATTTAGNVSVGTSATGSSPWQLLNVHIAPVAVDFQYDLGGSLAATGDIEYTLDPVLQPPWIYSQATLAVPNALKVMQSATTSSTASLTAPARAWRLTVTAGTGSAQAIGIQAGIRN